jgi:hypothetical protein
VERPGIQKGEFLLATFLSKRKVAFFLLLLKLSRKDRRGNRKGRKGCSYLGMKVKTNSRTTPQSLFDKGES